MEILNLRAFPAFLLTRVKVGSVFWDTWRPLCSKLQAWLELRVPRVCVEPLPPHPPGQSFHPLSRPVAGGRGIVCGGGGETQISCPLPRRETPLVGKEASLFEEETRAIFLEIRG